MSIKPKAFLGSRQKLINFVCKKLIERLNAVERTYCIKVTNTRNLEESDLFKVEGVKKVKIYERKIKITTLKGVENLDRLIYVIMNKGVAIYNITSSSISLGSVLLKLIGRN